MEEQITHEKQQSMSQILDVRYTDLEQEKLLCDDLLSWSLETGDVYAQAFALTYIGDYHLAKSAIDSAYQALTQAYSLLQTFSRDEHIDLFMHLFNFLGICSELRSDEQGCVQFYLEALTLARNTHDLMAECTALNNIGCAFQRHGDHEAAGRYFFEAYDLQKDIPGMVLRPTLLANMVEQSVSVENFDSARRFAEECDLVLGDDVENNTFSAYNWCCYYGAVGDAKEATRYAELALKQEAAFKEDPLAAFGLYRVFCSSMVKVGNEDLARRFLDLMEESCAKDCIDQLWRLGRARTEVSLVFGDEEEKSRAYRDFYLHNEVQTTPYNHFLAHALRTQVDLAEGIAQQESLQEQQESLEIEARIDDLTEIYNRRFFDHLIEERKNSFVEGSLAVVMIDVDFFKEYNDFYGHLEGDKVLKAVAAAAWRCKTEEVFPCRFGGDEFVCVCDGLDEDRVASYVQSVRQDLESQAIPHEKSRCSDRVTLSIGYAVSRDEENLPPYLLMQLADKALYKAKSEGRNAAVLERGDS